MKTQKTKTSRGTVIPPAVSRYIRNRFGAEFLTDFNITRNSSGKRFIYADVSHDNSLFHLKFDQAGRLLRSSDEPLIELYDEEAVGSED